jgi:hypothetical protein
VDHYLDPRDTLNFRYMFNQLSQVDPLSPGGASVPGFPVGENQRAQTLSRRTHTRFRQPLLVWRDCLSCATSFSSASTRTINCPPALDSNTRRVSTSPPGRRSSRSAAIPVGDPITGPRNTYEDVFDYSGR